MRRVLAGLVVLCQLGLGASGALASTGNALQPWPAGSNPPSNYPSKPGTEIGSAATPLPQACSSAPTGSTCVNAAVYYLDKARARLGQPAYKLPADFVKLGAVKEDFILTNLDRTLYKLPPIPGLTRALDQDALTTGVDNGSGADPHPTGPNIQSYTANWAGAFYNLPLAYEAWMFDDGYGSFNADCTSPSDPGCWGHRHDILWEFTSYGTGPLAMGAAGVKGRGYAMLIVRGASSAYKPKYNYTWKQAQKDGAGSHTYKVSQPS